MSVSIDSSVNVLGVKEELINKGRASGRAEEGSLKKLAFGQVLKTGQPCEGRLRGAERQGQRSQ